MPANLTTLNLEPNRRATVGPPSFLFWLTSTSIGRRPNRARAHPRVGKGNRDTAPASRHLIACTHARADFALFNARLDIGPERSDGRPDFP